MRGNGCSNCHHLLYYPSNSWYDPDEYECEMLEKGELTEESMTRAWENGEEWAFGDEPLCNCWREQEWPEEAD